MNKKYVSFDIEASGPTPGKYSMLSLGACIVGERETQFYREFKPLNLAYFLDAIKVGCLGLHCLKDVKDRPEFNPASDKFNPTKVLEVLCEKGEAPRTVMADYANWVLRSTKGFIPVEAAAPIKFDGMFTTWYFDNFYDRENPFGHSGEDMNSLYRGVARNADASMRDLKLVDDRKCAHNALDDAVFQAKVFEKVLELMKR